MSKGEKGEKPHPMGDVRKVEIGQVVDNVICDDLLKALMLRPFTRLKYR